MINKNKADLNKDGKLNSYEKKRGMAKAKAMSGRTEAKNGGSMSSNHEQLTGWGNVRSDVKNFGKK